MQTFLPVKSFEESARILDKKRCWKQVIEAKQILDTLITGRKAWCNHPATRMWRGYEGALAVYYNVFLMECIRYRGINVKKLSAVPLLDFDNIKSPPWLGYEPFHASHRSNLLRKLPEYYSQFHWTEPNNLPYLWPADLTWK